MAGPDERTIKIKRSMKDVEMLVLRRLTGVSLHTKIKREMKIFGKYHTIILHTNPSLR
jgi:hypothetical protein